MFKPLKRDKTKKNTLVMLSGGLDSTAALYWMLENTDDNIFVHRIVLDNHEKRSTAESEAVRKIIGWLETNCRSFGYRESSFSYSGYTVRDMFIYMHMAGVRGMEFKDKKCGGLDRIVTGSIKMYSIFAGVGRRRAKAWRIFTATYGKNHESVEWYKPLISHTKEQVYEYLPRELSDLTWSCRKPRGANKMKKCQRCHSCMAMKRVKGQLSHNQIAGYKNWQE